MKRIVKLIIEKFRDIKSQIWWFLYDKGYMKEYRVLQEEGERLEREWQEICLHAYEAMLEEEDQAQRSQWLEEYYQEPEEAQYEPEESYREGRRRRARRHRRELLRASLIGRRRRCRTSLT